MAEHEDFARMSSGELHDAAVKQAVRHGDLKFLWRLLEQIPAAEAVAGDAGASEADVNNVLSLLTDYVHAGDGKVADALRPLYLSYLTKGSGAS